MTTVIDSYRMALSLYDSLDYEIHLFDEMLSKEGKTRKDTEGGAYIDMLEERMRKIANGGAVTKTPCNGDTKPLNPNETETMKETETESSLENLGRRLDTVLSAKNTADHAFVDEATRQLRATIDGLFASGGDRLVQVLQMLKRLKDADMTNAGYLDGKGYTSMFIDNAGCTQYPDGRAPLTGTYKEARKCHLLLSTDPISVIYVAGALLRIYATNGNKPRLKAAFLVDTGIECDKYELEQLTACVQNRLFADYRHPTDMEIFRFTELLRRIREATHYLPIFLNDVASAISRTLDAIESETVRINAGTKQLNGRKEN